MNRKSIIVLSFMLVLASSLSCATRQMRNVYARKKNPVVEQEIPKVVVPQKPTLSAEEQQERDFFLTLLGIAASFGNVLLHKEDRPAVVQGVGDMIAGIVHAAEIITKYQTRIPSSELHEIIAEMLIRLTEEYEINKLTIAN